MFYRRDWIKWTSWVGEITNVLKSKTQNFEKNNFANNSLIANKWLIKESNCWKNISTD